MLTTLDRAVAARHAPMPFGATEPLSFADRVQLRHLRTPSDIEQVLPLRQEIDLSAHAMGDEFFRLEKKETNWGSSVPSKSTVS
jgi:hypothetical protein